MNKTRIEWCDMTLNPITGCSPISEGCANCYAKVMAHRLKAMNLKKYANEFKVTYHIEALNKPVPGEGKKIFIGSMTDVFHDDVKSEWIKDIFYFVSLNPQHAFLMLTKRPENIAFKIILTEHPWPANLWLGVTVESYKHLDRIATLSESWPGNKFVSFEPLLDDVVKWGGADPLGLVENGIGWVIVGAETGPKARVMFTEWAAKIAIQCRDKGIPFFFKKASKGWQTIEHREFPKEMNN